MVRLLLAEDHILVRQSIRAFLHDAGYAVIGEAGTGVEAVRLARELKPDLILMDIHLPEMNGIDAVRQIRQQSPDVRIIALTAYNEKVYQQALAGLGVDDFILKTAEFSVLLQSIQKAVRDQPPNSLSEATADPRLTEREIEVLRGAARGRTNKQIGVELDISARTVQVHLHTIFQKLGVANRTEAVLRAMSLKLIPSTDRDSD